jgi:hypothetical protein
MNTEKSGIMKKDIGQRFFSIAFHTRFFPSLLWSRLRPLEREGTSFVPIENYIAFVFCFVLAVAGIPNAINHHSIIGWVFGGTGLVGVLTLFISSICSRKGSPSYDGFLTGVFFFTVILGLTAGIFTGTLEHSFCLGLLGSAAGLVLGYVLGIFAGLWFQYLGSLAVLLDMLAGLAIIGMIVVDLVLLFG